MKLITRNTDYAIRALCFIANNDKEIVTTSLLNRKLKIPRPFLRKILQILNSEGILNSFKGQGGGFSLAVSPDKIYLLNLMEIFQGELELSECLFKKKICPDTKTCPLKRKILDIEKTIVSKLNSITIGSLLK